MRKATGLRHIHRERQVFQSPPSVRKATLEREKATLETEISIPAFREEGDQGESWRERIR